jgi:hypothetical protein
MIVASGPKAMARGKLNIFEIIRIRSRFDLGSGGPLYAGSDEKDDETHGALLSCG